MRKRISLGWWLLLAVAGLTALRLVVAGRAELLPEEAYYWTYAQNPAWGYFDHPPMVAWIIGAGTHWFGDTEFGVRFVNILLSVGTCLALWVTARWWFGAAAAHAATLLWVLLPVSVGAGLIVTPDAGLLFFWAVTLLAVTAAVKTERGFWWIVAGVSFGGALLTKYYAALLAPSVLLFLMLSPAHRGWLRRAEPWVALAVALAVFSPVIVWNAQHDWASFRFQTNRTAGPAGHVLENVCTFWLTQAGMVTPLVLALFVAVAARGVRRGWMRGEADWGFVVSFGLPVFALFALASFKTAVRINWTAPAFLALSVGAAAWLAERLADTQPARARRWRVAAWATVGLCVVVIGIGHGVLVWSWPQLGGSMQIRQWRALAEEVTAARDRLAEETGQSPFVLGGDKYNLAAALGFYTGLPGECVNTFALGEQGLGYRYWTPLLTWEGRPAVVVMKSVGARDVAALRRRFDVVGTPVMVTVASRSSRPPVLWVVECRGYHAALRAPGEGAL